MFLYNAENSRRQGYVQAWSHLFLISAVNGGEQSDFLSGPFAPGEEFPSTHFQH